MSGDTKSGTTRSILLLSLPAGTAIAVFGALYGAAAHPLLGTGGTIASSLLIFSGALQFAVVGLLTAGAAAPALLLTATTLNLRHLVLGAVLRARVGGSRLRRAGLAFGLLDETFGLAVAASSNESLGESSRTAVTERTLFVSGIVCYCAWQIGTWLGVLGAGLEAIAEAADAIFPVLFIGLAALATTSGDLVVRAAAAVVLTGAFAFAFPEARSLAPVVAGVLVALPGGRPDPNGEES